VKLCLPISLFFLSASVASAQTPASAADEVVARAGTVEIKVVDVAESLLHLSQDQKKALLADGDTIKQIVRSLVVERLVLNEASKKDWDKRVAVAIQARRAADFTVVESFLRSVSEAPAGYPSGDEIEEYYETNKASFFIPKSYRIAQIYIDDKPDEKAAAAKLTKVEGLLKAKDADFSALAKEHSEEPNSAARGGELGWLAEAQIQPEIRNQLPLMKLGGISEAVKLNDGWHLLRILDVKEASTLTLDQARPNIVEQLRSAKVKESSDAFLADLQRSNPVAINELALPKVLAVKIP